MYFINYHKIKIAYSEKTKECIANQPCSYRATKTAKTVV